MSVDLSMLKVDDVIKQLNGREELVEDLYLLRGNTYPFVVNGRTYMPNGRFLYNRLDNLDIIEIIPAEQPITDDERKLVKWAAQLKRQIAEQEQTISQLRANVARLVKEKDETVRRSIDLSIIEESLQTEIIGLREDVESRGKLITTLCSDIQILKTHVPTEGSLEWAIGQMRQGKKVRHDNAARESYLTIDNGYVVNEGGWRQIGILKMDGWQLFEEPPAKIELKVGQIYEGKDGLQREVIGVRGNSCAFYFDGRYAGGSTDLFLQNYTHKLISEAK